MLTNFHGVTITNSWACFYDNSADYRYIEFHCDNFTFKIYYPRYLAFIHRYKHSNNKSFYSVDLINIHTILFATRSHHLVCSNYPFKILDTD